MLDGDHEDTEFFPDGGQWLPENSENLKKAHAKIIRKAKEMADSGKKVVIDYIIFGRCVEFINELREAFDSDLQVAVLLPDMPENVERDKERECWTTGKDRIEAVRCEFQKIRDEIGEESYIDTSGETPRETLASIMK